MKSTSISQTKQRGFTLIESLITIAVSAVIATTALPSFSRWTDQQRLSGAAQQLLADLQLVRTEAVARQQGLRLTVRPSATGSCYVLHTGSAGACTCAPQSNAAAVCSGGASEIKTVHWSAADRVTLQASAPSMLFDPVDGTSTPTGTFTLTNPQGQALRHAVNVMGRTRTCAVGGGVSGHPVC